MSTPSSRPITTTSLARVLLMAAISLCLAACGPADPLEEARELQSAGQFEESLPILQELVAARPDLSEASYRHGVALNRTGKPELAVWALRQAATDETWAVQAGIELAAGALQVGNYQSALEATNHVLEVDPENAQALFLRAEAYLGEKTQPELALEDLERVLEKTPDNLPALSSRAAALIMLDRIDDAEAAIRDLEARALVLPPEKAGPGVSLGRLCITRALFENDRGNFEAAQEGLESCLETHPADRVVVQEAMTFFDSRGEQDRATEILTTALETQPNAHHYRRALGERLRAVGQVQEAEELLRAGVGIGGPSQRSGAWLAIADHFIALDELDPAADAFAKALALNPDPPVAAMLEYADLLARAKRYDEALEVASKFESDAYRGLIEARIHYDNDRPAEALARLEEVFVTWPNNAGARYYAARSAEQLGDFERAIAEYRQALRSGAGLTEAGLRLGKLHRGRGEFEAAFTAVNHYFSAQPRDEDAVAFLVRMTGRVGGPDRLRLLFLQLQGSEHYPRALAIQANLVAEREGHQAAIARVRLAEKSGLDLYHKRSAPMLRALVNHLGALERHDEASAALERALSTDPERADYHEILGLSLERRGAPLEEVRAAYLKALELDAKHTLALEALGRLAADEGKIEEALDFLDRATESKPSSPSAARRAALLTQEHGSPAEAEARWRSFLKEHPWDGKAALALARLRVEQGDTGDETLKMSRRALRFSAAPEAGSFVAELHDTRGEAELAAEVRKFVAAIEVAPPANPTPQGE